VIRFVFAPPGLGSVDQNPDNVRQEACRIVSPNQKVCTPATTTPPKVAGGSSFDLSWVSLLMWVLLIAGVIALLVLLVRFVAGRGWTRRPRHDDEDPDDDLDEMELAAVAVDRSREPVNWRAEADEHRRAGRIRDALRCRYRALVGDLARRGLIDEIPGRTTGEERAQLSGARPAASMPFTAAADLFDDAWYGHVEVAAGDDDRFQALERDVLSVTGVRR
jgi:hypothetical protein